MRTRLAQMPLVEADKTLLDWNIHWDVLHAGYCLQIHHQPPSKTEVCPTNLQDPSQLAILTVDMAGVFLTYFLILKKSRIHPILNMRAINVF